MIMFVYITTYILAAKTMMVVKGYIYIYVCVCVCVCVIGRKRVLAGEASIAACRNSH
jgi:hypothetical protein